MKFERVQASGAQGAYEGVKKGLYNAPFDNFGRFSMKAELRVGEGFTNASTGFIRVLRA